MTLENNLITFHKPTSPEIGSGSVDLSNCVKLTGGLFNFNTVFVFSTPASSSFII
jgi:hypothetical protein